MVSISESYIEENANKIDWREVSLGAPINDFSFDFISRFLNRWNWVILSSRKLSEGFIRRFKENVDWESISRHQILSESFIIEFQHQLDWNAISIFQQLSEDFIRKYQEKVSWSYISDSQKLSEAFVIEFADKVNWYNIFWNTKSKFSNEFKDKYRSRI